MVRVIIADDHLVLRQGLCELLEGQGKYSVVGQAENGLELMELLKTHTADVVILDVQMPKLDGLTALEQIQKEANKIPVLVLSADESGKNVRDALKAGAQGFVPKNAGVDELEFAIKAVLDGKTYVSPSVTRSLLSTPEDSTTVLENPLAALTKREVEVLTHLADGKPNRVIGKMLHISTRTVDTHRSNILKKLNLKTNAELVKVAISARLISI